MPRTKKTKETDYDAFAKLRVTVKEPALPETVSKRYLAILESMRALHIAKNTAYSGTNTKDPWSNLRAVERDFSIPARQGVITRMSDKWSRFKSLWADPRLDRSNESLRDTLIDLASYCLMLVCLLDEDKLGQENN